MIARRTLLKKSRSTLKRKPFSVKRATGGKKKKQTKKDILRSWLLPETYNWSSLRYKHPAEKGIYWYYFSLFTRQRDVQQWGTCISCGKPITVETSQAGHFIAAHGGGRDLLFDYLNVNAECPNCNGNDENHLWGYERNLIKRYGPEAPKLLKDKFFLYKQLTEPVKDWNAATYAQMIKDLPSYQQRLAQTSSNVV